jgi:parallel beta-helix repeat protein
MAAITAGALCGLAPVAVAAPDICNTPITADVTLDADVTCPLVSVITIGADRVTLDLNGHVVHDAFIAVDGRERVTIRNGSVLAIFLHDVHRSRVLDMFLPPGDGQLELTDSSRNLIEGNTVESAFGDPIRLIGSDRNTIRGNELEGHQAGGLSLDQNSDHNDVIGNTARGDQNPAIAVAGSRNALSDNAAVASGAHGGIFLTDAIRIFDGDRNLVEGNIVNSDTDGIFVAAPTSRTIVEGNTANGNGDDGIDVESRATTLRRNVANGNGDLGIEAVLGVRDRGGNSAVGNGNPLQCLNVVCG